DRRGPPHRYGSSVIALLRRDGVRAARRGRGAVAGTRSSSIDGGCDGGGASLVSAIGPGAAGAGAAGSGRAAVATGAVACGCRIAKIANRDSAANATAGAIARAR